MLQDESSHFTDLLQRYLSNTATQQEQDNLMQLVGTGEYEEIIKSLIDTEFARDGVQYQMDLELSNIILQNILSNNRSNVISFKRLGTWARIAAAAAIIFFITLAVILSLSKDEPNTDSISSTQNKATDVTAPANSKARITLADGRTVSLDSLSSGTLANQGNVTITKTAAGQIIYGGSNSPSGPGASSAALNTLSNPRGSTVIDMTLADGSRVWLNAGSSLTYPVAFTGNERKVSITGEAYFEVAHNASMPFKVSKGEIEVQVLGTQFNVNTYEDETDLKVTLVEGSVNVILSLPKGSVPSVNTSVPAVYPDAGRVVKLTPGQQAQINASTNQRINVSSNIDLDEVMAWKNGFFNFKSADLKEIMRQAARWYDVEVEYEGNISNERYKGKVARSTNLSQLMKILELNGIKYNIEGKKVTLSD